MPSNTPTKSTLIIQKSDHRGVVCFARLVGPNGMFVDFVMDKDMAENTLAELEHHLKRYNEQN
tara:strand:- start:292 stop:480 length:189 start_codon:yes stop_codon:yes gene_type:complete